MEIFEKLMLPITIILVLGLGVVFVFGSETTENPPTLSKDYITKRGEMGAVTIEITPLSAEKYEIILNTHSVELDFDVTKIVELKDNLGNIYSAKTWSGERGGHHLQGEIVFPNIDTNATGVTIRVTSIENTVLNLEWELR